MGNYFRAETRFFLEKALGIAQGICSKRGEVSNGGKKRWFFVRLGPYAKRIGISLPMHVIRNYVLEP
jgi:hypothetical protein